MREILFRGKTPRQDEHFDDGEWVEGFYTRFNGKEHRIYSGYAETDCGDYYPDWFNVRPETVGQYTGLTDKNGKKIFEGDIVLDLDGRMDGIPRMVCWDEKYLALHAPLVRSHWAYGTNSCSLWLMRGNNIEVIGNIHDNPELLKGE